METLSQMLEAYRVGRIPLDRREEKQIERLNMASEATQKASTLRAKISVASRALEEAQADEKADVAETIHRGILELTDLADHAEAEAAALHSEHQEETLAIRKESNALADKILAEIFPTLRTKSHDILRAAIERIEEIDDSIHEYAKKTSATLGSKHREGLTPSASLSGPEEKKLARAMDYWFGGRSGAPLKNRKETTL
jgi:hypothetical protein